MHVHTSTYIYPPTHLEAEDGLVDEARDEAVLHLLLAQLGPRVAALDVPLHDLLFVFGLVLVEGVNGVNGWMDGRAERWFPFITQDPAGKKETCAHASHNQPAKPNQPNIQPDTDIWDGPVPRG